MTDPDDVDIAVPDLLAVRMQILEFVRAREEGTGDVHRLDVHTFERRLDLLLDELVRVCTHRRTQAMKPTADDIATAIVMIAAGDWIDPSEVQAEWECRLFDCSGEFRCDGHGHTRGQAMALAWIGAHDNDALGRGYVEVDWLPTEIPNDWRFELVERPPIGSTRA